MVVSVLALGSDPFNCLICNWCIGYWSLVYWFKKVAPQLKSVAQVIKDEGFVKLGVFVCW